MMVKCWLTIVQIVVDDWLCLIVVTMAITNNKKTAMAGTHGDNQLTCSFATVLTNTTAYADDGMMMIPHCISLNRGTFQPLSTVSHHYYP